MGRTKVVIVGGGFGGLYTARILAKHPVDVTVVDRKNHHVFPPLLYQVATAGLSPAEIAVPIRQIFERSPNVRVLMDEVIGFDLQSRRVHTRELSLPYDYLVVAAGATHSYFGKDEWETFAPGLKTIEDAIEIRRRVLLAFELAERRAFTGAPREPLNFVVIGGGPTGVELAGTLAEIAKRALADDFRGIDPERARILLVEAGPRVLSSFPEELSVSAARQLAKLGVEVLTNTRVTGVEAGRVLLNGEPMDAAVTLWAAGVQASPLGKMLGAETDRAGRVTVAHDCTLPGRHEVFVIGDLAAARDGRGLPLPGVAPVAIQQGQYVGKVIAAEARAGGIGERKPFRYWNKGNLATIGRAAAVADFGRVRVSGFVAWILWLFIHIFFLIGFRNRLIVMLDWAWSYFTLERGARLITGDTSLPGVGAKPGAHEETASKVA